MVNAQAPEKFTVRFLESLGFKGNADRLIVGVLKSLGFLGDDGRPTQRYFDYLDQTQSASVMAEAVQEAYADLFQVNKNAQSMGHGKVVNKFKTLSQGQYSEAVLKKMASTFLSLCALADFKTTKPKRIEKPAEEPKNGEADEQPPFDLGDADSKMKIGGPVYNIQLILPESRDPKFYEALFHALRKHLA